MTTDRSLESFFFSQIVLKIEMKQGMNLLLGFLEITAFFLFSMCSEQFVKERCKSKKQTTVIF